MLSGGTAMGVGVGLMHYIGMAAMQMPATIRYDPALFLLSLAIAIVASIVALMVTVQGGIKKTSNMKSHVISTKTSLDWIYTG